MSKRGCESMNVTNGRAGIPTKMQMMNNYRNTILFVINIDQRNNFFYNASDSTAYNRSQCYVCQQRYKGSKFCKLVI